MGIFKVISFVDKNYFIEGRSASDAVEIFKKHFDIKFEEVRERSKFDSTAFKAFAESNEWFQESNVKSVVLLEGVNQILPE